ncbi:MAG: hypothetical protein MUO43_12225 [Desulfobacterales bacterium]|nr:hypothetical protein [Desulfobacterales bacterium]
MYIKTDKGTYVNTMFYPKAIINLRNFDEIADEDARWGYSMHLRHES